MKLVKDFVCDHRFVYWNYIPLCRENIKVLFLLFPCIFISVRADAVELLCLEFV